MKTLIITVGTRQVGWRCGDGFVRSIGADGGRDHPKHIDALYAELGMERSYHGGEQAAPQYPWSVRHLGQELYNWCKLYDDFGPVELLLDHNIIAQEVKDGLKQIILWGTDQPETVSWNYRRADTVWLARLMEGKIRQTWPDVEVDVWNPIVVANDDSAIYQEIEGFLLDYIRESSNPVSYDLTLMIQTKGSAPAISSAMDICAAALIRQYAVVKVVPIEPTPLFEDAETNNQARQARPSKRFTKIAIGVFFWPMERERIASAWERGDFSEAKVWLEAHRDRYDVLYKLADLMALASNDEVNKSLKQLRDGWIRSKAVGKLVSAEQQQIWSQQSSQLLEDSLESNAQAVWEVLLFVELSLKRENYTPGFMQFAQLLERVLNIRAKKERWIQKGFIQIKSTYKGLSEDYSAGFGGLLRGWAKMRNLNKDGSEFKLIDGIINKRNEIVHSGKSINVIEMRSLWTNAGFSVKVTSDSTEMMNLMMQAFDLVTEAGWVMPEGRLFKSLYGWGLEILRQ